MAKEYQKPVGGSPPGSDADYAEPGSEGAEQLKDQIENGGISSHTTEGKA